jgi:hypothetical protein
MESIEFLVISCLVIFQFYIFAQNWKAINALQKIFPYPEQLSTNTVDIEGIKYELIVDNEESKEFSQIVTDTNKYLQNNKGAAADLGLLKDISESTTDSIDEKVQAQIATPLYLGLLGTFAGAILGIGSIITTSDTSTIQSEDLGRFLFGILIAMIGSFFGLLLTLWGNHLLKNAKAQRNELKNAYYTFLRTSLLPRLNSDMQTSMSSLKAVLDTFNQDFFGKIQDDFFQQIAKFVPLIGQLTQNIAVQKDFLQKVEDIGITNLANASIKVWERVDQSAHHFEKFLGYQETLNEGLVDAKHSVEIVSKMLNRLGSLEEAINAVPTYLVKHDDTLREWVQFFTQHNKLLGDASLGMQQSVQESGHKLQAMLERSESQFEADSQEAYEKWRAHFKQLHDDNIYQKIIEFLHPFQNLPEQQAALNKIQENQAKKMTQVIDRLEGSLQSNSEVIKRLDSTSKLLVDVITRPNWFERMIKVKKKKELNGNGVYK